MDSADWIYSRIFDAAVISELINISSKTKNAKHNTIM